MRKATSPTLPSLREILAVNSVATGEVVRLLALFLATIFLHFGAAMADFHSVLGIVATALAAVVLIPLFVERLALPRHPRRRSRALVN
jgi:hypothetical protein